MHATAEKQLPLSTKDLKIRLRRNQWLKLRAAAARARRPMAHVAADLLVDFLERLPDPAERVGA